MNSHEPPSQKFMHILKQREMRELREELYQFILNNCTVILPDGAECDSEETLIAAMGESNEQ